MFNRSSRRAIALTDDGRALLPKAREALSHMEGLLLAAQGREEEKRSHLRIGLISSVASTKLASLLREFRKQNPMIEVSLVDHPSKWILQAVREGRIDVGIVGAGKFLKMSAH